MGRKKKRVKSDSAKGGEKRTQKRQNKTENSAAVFIYTVIAAGIILRLMFPILNTGMWHDECALGINVLDRDFWGLFNPLRFLQVAPPMFLSAVKLCTLPINPVDNPVITDFALRIVPLVSGIGAIFAFYYLLKNLFVNKYIQLAGIIMFALNPVLIQYSYELKPYSTDVLAAILLVLYFVRYNPDSYKRQFLQMLLISLSMFVSFPSAFIISGGLLNILFRDYKKFFCALTAFLLVLVFYFVYHIWGVMETHGQGMDNYWAAYFVAPRNIADLSVAVVKNSFNIFVLPLVTLGVLAAGAVAACVRDRKIAVITITAVLLTLCASYLHLYPFAVRMLLFLMPLLIILVCEVFDIIPNGIDKLVPAAILVLCGYYLFIMNGGILSKINTRTNLGVKEMAAAVNTGGYSVVIPKNSNVEWIYYSRFYNFSPECVYFQDWNTPDSDWLKTIPAHKYYYFAPFETRIPEKVSKKSSGVIKLGSRGIILKVD